MSEILLRIGRESEAGNYSEALRWADRADRYMPDDEIVNEILGRLLSRLGDNERALPRLKFAYNLRPDPSLQAAIIDALFAMRRIRQGFAALEAALGRFAVTPGSELALCARRHTLGGDLPAPGWVGIAPDLQAIGEIRANLPGGLRLLSHAFRSLAPVLEPLGPDAALGWSFSAAMPKGYEGDLGATAGSAVLLGSDASFPPRFNPDGRCEVVDGRLVGWVRLGWAPTLSPPVVISQHGKELTRGASRPPESRDGRHSFSFRLSESGFLDGALDVAVELPDLCLEPFPDSPALVQLPLPPIGTDRRPRQRGGALRGPLPDVDVVVPVYSGHSEALTCLESVRKYSEGVADVIVINDASPDPALTADLERMAAAGEITLLVNEVNLGFAASCNRGLELHPDRDTIILNSDAEVFPEWVSRLKRAAYSAPDIGTVTPLTNSGTIASYPHDDGSPCTSDGASRIAQIAAEVNDGFVVDAPTGIGFCLYVREDCRAATGPLDSDCFGRGYGEENDFCMRAAGLGWRHVLTADIYVRHLEGQSFGASRNALMDRNAKLLNRRYPEYDRQVANFSALDPLRMARRRLDERRLQDAEAPYVLLITLSLPGGVDRYVQARRQAIRKFGSIPLVLKPSADSALVTLTSDNESLNSLEYEKDEIFDLGSILTTLKIAKVEIHHFHGLDESIVELAFTPDRDVDIIIHDYSWICPRISLLGGEGRYCGEPDLAGCDRCIALNGAALAEAISTRDLRLRSARWLGLAKRVIVPTEDVKARLERYFPNMALTVQPWETDEFEPAERPEPSEKPLRVLSIGAIGEQKGFNVLLDCARDAAERQLDLEFVVAGFTEDDEALQAYGNVFITGRFEEKEIGALVVREAPDIAFYASVTPETWCFSLSHALRAGLPILAFDIGAIAERLRAANTLAALLPLASPSEEINNALLSLGGRRTKPWNSTPAVEPPDPEPNLDLELQTSDPDPTNYPLSVDGIEADPVADAKDPEPFIATPSVPPPAEPSPPPPAAQERPMSNATISPKANVQLLSLPQGIYQFSVKAAAPRRPAGPTNLVLPAVQIALAPGVAADSVEYMSGLQNDGAWLFDANDLLIAKVKVDGAPILITSYSAPGLSALRLEVERMGGQKSEELPPLVAPPPIAYGGPPPSALSPEPLIGASSRRTFDGRRILPTRIIAHISRRGDVAFIDQPWAGTLDQKLPIEGFMIEPLAGLASADIEYKGLTEKGVETPWLAGGAFCGTRQLNMALSGFSVRVKGAKARQFGCQYRGLFGSGETIGPFSDGQPLKSRSLDDFLQAIEVSFIEKAPAVQPTARAAPPPATAPSPPAPLAALSGHDPVRAVQPEAAAPRPRKAVGPRFSVFREDGG